MAGRGLWFDYGAAVLRLRSDSPALAEQLRSVYRSFDFVTDGTWADLHVQMTRPRGIRRLIGSQVVFRCDGTQPFQPFPAHSPLPLLEWGSNWLIGQRLNDRLLLHAGAVERDGLALLLPARPGSGKSTLTAALSLSGWRLLSDEFGVYDPAAGTLEALLKPIALKNASIQVMREFAPHAAIGPEFPKTRKGTVAHLGADEHAVSRRHQAAVPVAVVLPKWVQGSPTRLEPITADRLFPALAFNSFNYTTLGAVGFRAAVDLVRRCRGWTLVYSDLGEALQTIDAEWSRIVEARRARPEMEVSA